ncbi:hypothetical protein GH714_038241 [Hevea brasiliensis]|uniref:Uncharacterized protein n=1 Tax=Hevea brasiliensis TaxID=3981 RepID=A0A6A6L8M3_HEVBR|nr:hypothetical protein GH714_038241 [Hevea brasiliensis]
MGLVNCKSVIVKRDFRGVVKAEMFGQLTSGLEASWSKLKGEDFNLSFHGPCLPQLDVLFFFFFFKMASHWKFDRSSSPGTFIVLSFSNSICVVDVKYIAKEREKSELLAESPARRKRIAQDSGKTEQQAPPGTARRKRRSESRRQFADSASSRPSPRGFGSRN